MEASNQRNEEASKPSSGQSRQWSRRALAYQSATSLARLEGKARNDALERHFEQFPPDIGTSLVCRTIRF
jgi:hypothetical protein